jgi:hypothetical protein
VDLPALRGYRLTADGVWNVADLGGPGPGEARHIRRRASSGVVIILAASSA